MKAKELTTKSVTELQNMLTDNRVELQQLTFSSHAGQLKQVRKIRALKKQIAQVLTQLNQANRQATGNQDDKQ